nr:putative reverse transcriptase, RNA-dependent DNA polymerase [Tanacetum cinerariifolium]
MFTALERKQKSIQSFKLKALISFLLAAYAKVVGIKRLLSVDEVIAAINGDSPLPMRTIDGVEQTYPPTITEEKLARKNKLKARGTLLMALQNEHQLKFYSYKNAKSLMEAIEKRFGGNKESKKVQKTLLKQQYENFNRNSSEGLDQIYDRLQKLISQLKIHRETISQEDLNLKLLRSLPLKWKTHTLIWRNKPDLETLSMDDIYNNIKIYKTKVKGSSSSSQNSQNVAFVSSNSSGSTNQAHGSNSANTDSLSDVVIYSFFANQSNSPLLYNEDLQQIDADDLEEIDLKWQMAMLTMGARRFLKKTGMKVGANGSETIGAPKENRNREPVRRNVTVKTTYANALVAQDEFRYNWSDQAEDRPTNFALMAYTSSGSSSSSNSDTKETPKEEKSLVKVKSVHVDFEDVYFVKELKFNLFSISQMCDKKNNVLFTDTECVVLSPDFKLLDESQVLLRVLKKNNMYIVDLKNVAPSGARVETVPDKYYILLPLWTQDPLFSSSSKDSPDDGFKPSKEEEKKDAEDPGNEDNKVLSTEEPRVNQKKDANVNSTNNINTVSPTANVASTKDNIVDENIVYGYVGAEADMTNFDTNIPKDDKECDWPWAIGAKWIYKNKKDKRGIVVRNKVRLVTHGYTQEEGIDYDEVFAPAARIEAIRLFLAYASFKDFVVYRMDVKSAFLYSKIEEEVYVCQPPGFEDPEFIDRVYKVGKALYGIHQAPRACQDKYVDEIFKKFGFSTVKTLSTPMETSKPLMKDENVEDVDVHLYRLMIGSLMYLTSSRPDIMFVVCACARFQVKPKVLHLHAIKRIFRYLKGQPKLGLWYPKDSPFNLEAYTNSDYAGASLDRKSTTGGCQFLGSRLILWQCKKQTVVASSTTKAEYVAASNCYGQVLWIQNQMLDYGYNFINTKIFIDNENTICIVKNPIFHSKTKHIEIRHHFIRNSYEKRLIQVIKIHTDHNVADLLTKAFDVSRFQFLTASIGMLNL